MCRHKGGRSATLALATRPFSSSMEGCSAPLSTAGTARVDNTKPSANTRENREGTLPNTLRSSWLFLPLKCVQAVRGMPLLIRILPLGNIEEEVKIAGGILVVALVIVGRSAQEICHRSFQQQLGPRIQRTNHNGIVLVLIGGEGEVVISVSKARLELHGIDELTLSFLRFLLPQQSLAKSVMQFRVVRMSNQQLAIGSLGQF